MDNDVNIEVTENNNEAQQEEKLFTGEEVERIVKKRLERFREKRHDSQAEDLAAREQAFNEREQAFNEREQAFNARESKLSCMEFCYKNNYDLEFIDILDTSDPKVFKDKVEKVSRINTAKKYVAPPATYEAVDLGKPGGPLAEAFSPDYKHTPKKWPISNDD